MTQTVEVLDKLIGFDTVSANSNLDMIDFIETYLTERGFQTTRLMDPNGDKAGLVAERGPAGRGIVLSGHTDVVPTTGQAWTRDAFKLTQDQGRLYGRGTTDMKGYLACMLTAADRAAQYDLKEPLKLVFSYDEEIGCVGIQRMFDPLKACIGQPRACFVGEPTEMQVAIGHKGKAALRATFVGQNGHSALAPTFVNALHLAGDFMMELRGLQAEFAKSGAQDPAYDVPYSTVHIGKLSGGVALNIVPDHAEMTFEYRHLAADPSDQIFDKICAAAARVEAAYSDQFAGAQILLERYNAYPGLDVADTTEIAALAKRLAQTDTTKVAFGTEAGMFEQLGIPTVVCGPGSMAGQGHKPDEFVTAQQLAACDDMLTGVLVELAN